MSAPEKVWAHDLVRHPEEGEARPLAEVVRYHYAQAIAYHYAFADNIGGDVLVWGRALSDYLRHAHLAFLHDALDQGLTGQAASDWAASRNHSESGEWVWERAYLHGIDAERIRAYEIGGAR